MLYRYKPTTVSSISSTYVRVCCRWVSEPRAQHSTAQHTAITPCTKQQTKRFRADQSTYPKIYVRTWMLRPGCFPGAWSSWHLQVACLHLKMLGHLLHLSVIPINMKYYSFALRQCIVHPFFLVSETSGWNRPRREAPCTAHIHLMASWLDEETGQPRRLFDQ